MNPIVARSRPMKVRAYARDWWHRHRSGDVVQGAASRQLRLTGLACYLWHIRPAGSCSGIDQIAHQGVEPQRAQAR